jgi:deoxyinosine 3'endonuclease (endonuclease V)
VLAAVDVHYGTDHARAACVGFARWTDDVASYEATRLHAGAPAAYAPGRPGLGAYLSSAIGVPVIGVAKTQFVSANAIRVVRASTRPLYVTGVGIDPAEAASHIASMHGPYRLPTLLKLVDSRARGRSRSP